MAGIAAVILAAGEGTRMKSSTPKVLHPVCGKPMIRRLIETLESAGIKKTVVVIGHKAGLVKKSLANATCVRQPQLLGTGDALLKTKALLVKARGIDTVLVTYGDVCLLRKETLKALIERHISTKAACTILTGRIKNPTGYGRIIRSSEGRIIRIVEEVEASIYDRIIEEVNTGVYCFDKRVVFDVLSELRPSKKKGEYYLTDAVEIMHKKGLLIESVVCEDENEFIGINTRKELSQAEKVLRERILNDIMNRGVTVLDPDNTFVSDEAKIEPDTIIYPYTFIENNVKIGPACSIGPFARLRSGTELGEGVVVGNFVEIVRSRIGPGTKIKHHTYIGDTLVGRGVNIGAGTIVANYDGKKKHLSVIEDGAFIGTGTILIAPVRVGRGAVTGAGSVVTKNHDVPPGRTVVGVPARILKKKRRRDKK